MNKHSRRVGTNILLVKDGKILLLRRIHAAWGHNTLVLPGGHLEQGETARKTAMRELKEELDLDISKDRLQFFASVIVLTNYEYVNQEFYVELQSNEEPVNKEPEKCSELVWCDPKKLPNEVQEIFHTIIQQGYIDGKLYLEIGY